MYGISFDPVELQDRFAKREKLNFLLLSDVNKEAGQKFGAVRVGGLPFPKRVTFVLDTCTYVTSILRPGTRTVMTNSGKWAHYAPGNMGVDVVLATSTNRRGEPDPTVPQSVEATIVAFSPPGVQTSRSPSTSGDSL